MFKFIKDIIAILRWHNYWAILDPDDSSVTISETLYKHIDKHFKDANDVMVFRIPATDSYAFTINPVQEGWISEAELVGEDLGEKDKGSPAISTLQYNYKFKSFGFATAQPTVAYMLTEWDQELTKVKVTVKPRKISGRLIYQICR